MNIELFKKFNKKSAFSNPTIYFGDDYVFMKNYTNILRTKNTTNISNCAVSASQFIDVVTRLDGFDLEDGESSIIVKSGDVKVEVSKIDDQIVFPEIKSIANIDNIDSIKKIAEFLDGVVQTKSIHQVYDINDINITKDIIFSTNGFMLIAVDVEENESKMILPADAIRLANDYHLNLGISGNFLAAFDDDNMILFQMKEYSQKIDTNAEVAKGIFPEGEYVKIEDKDVENIDRFSHIGEVITLKTNSDTNKIDAFIKSDSTSAIINTNMSFTINDNISFNCKMFMSLLKKSDELTFSDKLVAFRKKIDSGYIKSVLVRVVV